MHISLFEEEQKLSNPSMAGSWNSSGTYRIFSITDLLPTAPSSD